MADTFYRRFDRLDRGLHLALMASFLGLSASGLPLIFADRRWAQVLARLLGGFEVAGGLHRLSALLLIAVFAVHLGRVTRQVLRGDWGVLWGPRSLVPQPKDGADLVGHLRWFVGQGPRPVFDRYTYWEKFDYLAVFWGMAIIGGSGVMLWFPEFFARVLPGWVFNVAMLVHGEEAVLAVGFIFTIHFFNGHLRPEKFPMDLVIFTGRISAHELQQERPAELARLEAAGQLAELQVTPPTPGLRMAGMVIGAITVAVGLILVALTFYGLFGPAT